MKLPFGYPTYLADCTWLQFAKVKEMSCRGWTVFGMNRETLEVEMRRPGAVKFVRRNGDAICK